jgi:hypothetical protein
MLLQVRAVERGGTGGVDRVRACVSALLSCAVWGGPRACGHAVSGKTTKGTERPKVPKAECSDDGQNCAVRGLGSVAIEKNYAAQTLNLNDQQLRIIRRLVFTSGAQREATPDDHLNNSSSSNSSFQRGGGGGGGGGKVDVEVPWALQRLRGCVACIAGVRDAGAAYAYAFATRPACCRHAAW